MVTTAAIREHYDRFAFLYHTFWGDHIHHGLFESPGESPARAQLRMLEFCASLCDIHGGESVLDVGCGHGGTCVFLAGTFNCAVRGLTISGVQANRARKNTARAGLSTRVAIEVGNADEYLFPSETFDIVWTMESSEHFRDKLAFIRNASRSLRSSGRLLIAAWTGSMNRARVRAVAQEFLCPELWSADQYSEAAISAGLHIASRVDLTAKVIRTWEICRRRTLLARPVAIALPRAAREFADSIETILDAYRSGDLTYTVLVANKS